MRNTLAKFFSDERGATSIEYGVIAAVVGLSLVVALASLPGYLNGTFSRLSDELK